MTCINKHSLCSVSKSKISYLKMLEYLVIFDQVLKNVFHQPEQTVTEDILELCRREIFPVSLSLLCQLRSQR